ncbi:carbon-phosphorus lyase complex subunit PhnI [Streptomyces sp. NPDC046821]|uniref:carbon-phosphorus lyase complex subunit PhnI n=1 Tax=Streptomyces sp. NPDC046821 TaxID=3154702 RepID=UPI0033D24361
MGYAGVRGGQEAIAAAERLVRAARYGGESDWLELDQITAWLPLAVDRVMGEAGLWAPELAARAVRQSQGDLLEAAQLLRAHRSTLPRLGYSRPAEAAAELLPVRRVTPVQHTSRYGQLYGYGDRHAPRVLDLAPEETLRRRARTHATRAADSTPQRPEPFDPGLEASGLLASRRDPTDPEPYDITRAPARPGTPRSARLSALARAETGSLTHLWYTTTRSPRHSASDAALEVRRGRLPVRMPHPVTGRPVTVAHVTVTEARTVRPDDRPRTNGSRFDAGYGLCLGDGEAKALGMAALDLMVHRDPATDRLEQNVLISLDGPEASGFLEHLKLPHYVDFRSTLDRIRAVHATAPAHSPVPSPSPSPSPEQTEAAR